MSIDWAAFGVDLHLELDQATGRRAALERALRAAIRAGRLAPGSRLPATRALAGELGLSRGTVSAAYDQLVAEGFLSARTGSGTVVAALAEVRARDGVPATEEPAPPYDLRPGRPDVSTFPAAAWLSATRRALASAPAAAYDYGDARGRLELRTALAGYLGRARGVLAPPERIVVTTGYVQSLALLARVLGGPAGPVIAMEDPGLPFHRDVVRYAGAAVLPLAVDGSGARTDLLSTSDFSATRAVVLTPAHQYPIGVTLHPQRRRAATAWARSRGGLVIEDDYDGEFRYDRQPVGALQGTAPEHVAYLGTASKTLGPGLRLGWMVLPEHLVEPVLVAKRHTDMHTASLSQLALADLIAGHGYDRHIRSGRLRYRRRRDLLLARLGPLARQGFTVRGIAAGLHALIDLPPSGPDEERVISRAAAHGLAVGGLGSHWHAPGDHPGGLIVGYGTPTGSGYPAALDILVRVLRTTRP